MKQEVVPTKRTKVVNIRLLPSDANLLQHMADKKGLAVSTYCYLVIKNLIDEQLEKV